MAPASKRMSAEEKRTTILGIFHNLKDVYIEKEVSLRAAREGILDGSVMIYIVEDDVYYIATGTTGDQRYALTSEF